MIAFRAISTPIILSRRPSFFLVVHVSRDSAGSILIVGHRLGESGPRVEELHSVNGVSCRSWLKERCSFENIYTLPMERPAVYAFPFNELSILAPRQWPRERELPGKVLYLGR